MSSREHQQAQELAAQAAGLAKAGRGAEARLLYEQAAEWEKKAVDQLPADKRRTRGILGISLVSLLYKARALAQAETAAQALLHRPDLLPTARRELETMLQSIATQQAANGSSVGTKEEARRL
jgi:hypothetical protein